MKKGFFILLGILLVFILFIQNVWVGEAQEKGAYLETPKCDVWYTFNTFNKNWDWNIVHCSAPVTQNSCLNESNGKKYTLNFFYYGLNENLTNKDETGGFGVFYQFGGISIENKNCVNILFGPAYEEGPINVSQEEEKVWEEIVPCSPNEILVNNECKPCFDCQALDETWREVGKILNIANATEGNVWNPVNKMWEGFDVEYPKPIAPVLLGAPISQPSAYDNIINTLASRYGVHPAIVKAIIHRESRFNPHAISTAGEIGLMQINYDSVPQGFRKGERCCGSPEADEKNIPNKGTQSCWNELKNRPNVWTEELYNQNVFKCHPNTDDRFDPEKNIEMGLTILKNCLKECDSNINQALSCYRIGNCIKKLDYASRVINVARGYGYTG